MNTNTILGYARRARKKVAGTFLMAVIAAPQLYTSNQVTIEFDPPSEYKAYVGLNGSIVSFVANSTKEDAAVTFSISNVDEKVSKKFLENTELQTAFQKDIFKQFEDSGFTQVTQQPIEKISLGSKSLLVFPYNYFYKNKRLKTAVLLFEVESSKTQALTGRFTTEESSFNKKWGQMQSHLASLKLKDKK